MNIVKRLLDRITHHYEYPTQRQYRRYLEGLDHAAPAEPYVFPGVATVTEGGTWGQWAERQKAIRDAEVRGPVIGVTAHDLNHTLRPESGCRHDMNEITACVICGRTLTAGRKHVDTCGERCYRSLLTQQRGGGR